MGMKILKWSLGALFVAALSFVLSAARCDIPVQTLKERYAKQSSRFLAMQGMNVHYADEGKGFPLVLVHGTAASLHTWDAWAEALTPHFRVIRMDLPAFGLTGPNESHDYSTRMYVDFMREFLDKTGVARCHMAGNSLGGAVAWNFAAYYPARVDRLVLIDAGGFPRTDDPPLPFRIARTPVINLVARWLTPRFVIRKSLLEVYGDDSKVTDDLVDRYYDMALREGNRAAFIARSARPDAPDTSLLKTIRAPVLIMWGAEDRWIPVENASRFKREIPGSRAIVYKGAGHVPMEEIPRETAADALNFLAGQ